MPALLELPLMIRLQLKRVLNTRQTGIPTQSQPNASPDFSQEAPLQQKTLVK
jgi:hypothetical protein